MSASRAGSNLAIPVPINVFFQILSMTTADVKVDSKGRVIIPSSFRETLGIKTGENMVAHLDNANGRIILFPIETGTKKLVIVFGDEPGCLFKAAAILARNKVDLVHTSSRSLKRGKEAEWEVIADFSKADMERLKAYLKASPAVKSFKLEQLMK